MYMSRNLNLMAGTQDHKNTKANDKVPHCCIPIPKLHNPPTDHVTKANPSLNPPLLIILIVERLDKGHGNARVTVHVQVDRVDGVTPGNGDGGGGCARSYGFGRDGAFRAALECCW